MKRHSNPNRTPSALPPEWADTARNPPRHEKQLDAFESPDGVCLYDPDDHKCYIVAPGVAVSGKR